MKNNCLYDEIHPVHRLAFVFDCRTYCQNCRDCLQFCFMHIIQQELDSIKREWNTHRIRVSKDHLVPAGIPEELFFLPQVHGITCDVNKFFLSQVITHAGTRDYISPTNYQDLQMAKNYAEEPDPPASLSFLLAAQQLMQQHSLHFPQNIHEAICLYVELVTLMNGYQ